MKNFIVCSNDTLSLLCEINNKNSVKCGIITLFIAKSLKKTAWKGRDVATKCSIYHICLFAGTRTM